MTIWQADVSPDVHHLTFFILKANRSNGYYVAVALRGGRELLAEPYAMTNDELDVLLNNSLLCYAPVLFCSFFDGCL